MQLLLPDLPFWEHLDYELLHLADSKSQQTFSKMNTIGWWFDTHDHLPARVTIVPVMCVCDQIRRTNVSGNQQALLLYPTIGNIQYDIHRTPHQCP
jgi:hypothetical protein